MGSNELPRVAYVGPVAFPEGGAAARRILGISQSLREAGYEVLIGSGQLPKPGVSEPEDFEGFPVYSLGERTGEHLPTILKHLSYLTMGRNTRSWLGTLDPKPTAVILYAGYSAYFSRLLPWCERNDIPLIFDAVEWYDPASVPGGKYGPYRWSFELAMRYFCVRCKHIIGISSLLQNYYKERGCETVRVPPTLDVQAVPSPSTTSREDVVTIGYAGTPGKKDGFDSMLEAILRADPEGKRLRFRVAGVTPEQVLKYPAIASRGLTSLPPSVEALGKVPHSEAVALIREADFSVLVRPLMRYAMAGFPTKVVESLAMGTPVICNLSSDLGMYLHDGQEAIVCADHSAESLTEAFKRALELSPAQRQAMRASARACAENSFDFRNFSAPLADFMRRCTKSAETPKPNVPSRVG
jgi:glycosyltransferase involved in cell wall biosynthesis